MEICPLNQVLMACEPLFLLINYIKMSTHSPGEMDELRKEIMNLLTMMKEKAGDNKVSPDEIEIAHYALVVFIDEVISHSSWSDSPIWKDKPLELELYGTNRGEDDFFNNKLVKIIKADYDTSNLIEIYYLCLVLGFKGKYRDEQNNLDLVKNTLLEKLKIKPGQQQELSPLWKASEKPLRKKGKKITQWIIPSISLFLVISVYVIFYFLIARFSEEAALIISELL